MLKRRFRVFCTLVLLATGCQSTIEPAEESSPDVVVAKEALTREIVVKFPQGGGVQSALIGADRSLIVDDSVELGDGTGLESVGVYGYDGAHLAGSVKAHADIESVGNIWIGSQADVDGTVTSFSAITLQDDTVDTGPRYQNTPVTPDTHSWSVDVPEIPDELVMMEPNTSATLNPGWHVGYHVKPGATLTLGTGTHFFKDLIVEPQAVVNLQSTGGATVIYVDRELTVKGPIVDIAGKRPNLLLVVLGTHTALFKAPLWGTVVAPNATVELRRPDYGYHRGAAFAEEVHLFSDVRFEHDPFDWTALGCPLGDSDKDGVNDCMDGCPYDPAKTEPGICNCGRPETNTDGDALPDCLDECDLDPTKTRAGHCGCDEAGGFRPAGTACADALDPEVVGTVCDGAGHCGDDAACAPVPGDCEVLEFDDKIYWYCASPMNRQDAADACEAACGLTLVQIDSRLENAVLTSWVDGPVWTGGNDLAEDGTWRWPTLPGGAESIFWTGGSVVDGYYANWAGGAPGAGGDCLYLAGDGDAATAWHAADCTETRGFICASPGTARQMRGPEIEIITCGDAIPGANCEMDTEPNDTDDCVDEDAEMPDSEEEITEDQEACADICTFEGDPDCADCEGVATYPSAFDACPSWDNPNPGLCALTSTNGVACETDADCTGSLSCGLVFECVNNTLPCDNAACTTGCGKNGFCIVPGRQRACDSTGCDPTLSCYKKQQCGARHPDCGNTDGMPSLCSEIELCIDPDAVGKSDLDETLLQNDFTPDLFDTPQHPLPPEYPPDPPCDTRSGGKCSDGENHKWCTMETEGSLEPLNVNSNDKHGNAGSGPVTFDVDPNLILDYSADPGYFGDVKFDLTAKAELTANVGFDIFGVDGDFEVLGAVAGIHAQRCKADTTDSRLEIFGLDFLPLLGINNIPYSTDEVFPKDSEGRTMSERCEASIGTFEKTVDRARKAYMDARELVKQYWALRDAGVQRFPDDLCERIAADPPEGFSTAPCTTSPEETINRFIQYYHDQADLIGPARNMLAGGVGEFANVVIPLGPQPPSTRSSMRDYEHAEVQQIAYVPFAIGPVPMSLEVEAYVAYGLGGEFKFSVNPFALGSTNEKIAEAVATATPWASSGITMFVGADLNIGIAGLKIGIEGELQLATLSLPVHGSAGFAAKAVPDPRYLAGELPEDLQRAAAGPRYPLNGPEQYEYSLTYDYGASMNLSGILRGTIAGKVRIKFLFFSKSWKKTVLTFPGFPSGGGVYEIPIIAGGGDLAATSTIKPPWGVLGMPVPFLTLNMLTPDPDAGSKTPDAEFSDLDVEELFYDSLCQCKEEGEDCYRHDDCCEAAPRCYEDPGMPGEKTCIKCVADGDNCNEHDDCCPSAPWCFSDPSTPSSPKVCTNCRGVGETCNENSDCCPWMGQAACYKEPWEAIYTCTDCRGKGETCQTDDDCCAGDTSADCVIEPWDPAGYGNCSDCVNWGWVLDRGDCCRDSEASPDFPGYWHCFEEIH